MPDLSLPASDTDLWEFVHRNPDVLSRSAGDYQLTSDSVDLATGWFAGFHRDFHLPGALPLDVTRYFRPHVAYASTGGSHCAWILDSRLIVGPGQVLLVDHDGAVVEFDAPTSQPCPSRSGPFRLLGKTPTGYQVITDEYRLLHFTSHEATLDHDEPIHTVPLAAITTRTGNRIRFQRDSDGHAQRLEHSAGVEVAFHTTGSRVIALDITGPGYAYQLSLDPYPFPDHAITTLSVPPRTNHAQPVTIRFDDGTTDRWWFDKAHTLRGWRGRFGGAMTRQVNTHRQTLRMESQGTSDKGSSISIVRNHTSEPAVITSGTDRYLIGYAFPGCIATIHREGRTTTEIAAVRWSAPDVPSELSVGRHQLEFDTTDDGILRKIHGTIGTAAFATDALGLPTAITTADGSHLEIRRDYENNTVTLTADDGSTREISVGPVESSSDFAPATTGSAGDAVIAVAERFPGHRCHALIVAGRRIRISRRPDGAITSAYIEGTGAVSGSDVAGTFGRLNLTFDPRTVETEKTEVHRDAITSVADPDTGQTVAVLDSVNEVSVRATFDHAPELGRSPAKWIHESGTTWSGEAPANRITPPESPTFAAECAPSGFLALCAIPSLDPDVATDATIQAWLHHITHLIATPGQFTATCLAKHLGEALR